MSFKKGVSAKPCAKAGLAAAERAVRRMWPSHRKREPIRPSTSLCYIRGRSRTDLADVSGVGVIHGFPLFIALHMGTQRKSRIRPCSGHPLSNVFFIASDPCLASALFRINKHFERCAEQEAMNILAFRPRTVRVKTHRPMLAPIKGAGIASPFPACQRVYRFTACGQGRIRTSELLRGLIYSQERLTTSLPTHHQFKQITINSMSCGRGDSDSHGFHHRNLNPARLPISPQPHEKPRQSAGAVMLFIYLTMRMRREPDTGGRKPEGVQGRKPDPCRAHNSYYMALYLFQYVKEHSSESPERPFGRLPRGRRCALAGPGSGAMHENVYPTCATCNFIYGYRVCCSVLTPYVFRNTSGFIPKNLSDRLLMSGGLTMQKYNSFKHPRQKKFQTYQQTYQQHNFSNSLNHSTFSNSHPNSNLRKQKLADFLCPPT